MPFNAELLKLVREQREKTQTELAEALDIKQALISKFERGVVVPTDEMVKKIAKCTNYPASFFSQQISVGLNGLVYHRKRTSLSAAKRSAIEAEGKLRALEAKAVCEKLGRGSDVLTRHERTPEEMACAIREYWQVPPRTIENLVALLENHGIVILKFDFGTDLLDGFWVPLEADFKLICIALNSNPAFSADRQRFTLCHELGHALLHEDKFPGKEAEQEANRFAGEFLLPQRLVSDDLTPPISFSRLKELKTKWKASMGSLLFRAKEIGKLKESNYRRMWSFLSEMGFRKWEPNCGIEFETPTLLRQMFKEIGSDEDVCSLSHLNLSEFQKRHSTL